MNPALPEPRCFGGDDDERGCSVCDQVVTAGEGLCVKVMASGGESRHACICRRLKCLQIAKATTWRSIDDDVPDTVDELLA